MKKTGYRDHIIETAGTLRARIACRQDALRTAQPDSWMWWHLNRTIADLERQVAEKEGVR